ncbi:MAG: hypothetical protein AAGG68_30465 [Bacteroidota bacterium]
MLVKTTVLDAIQQTPNEFSLEDLTSLSTYLTLFSKDPSDRNEMRSKAWDAKA